MSTPRFLVTREIPEPGPSIPVSYTHLRAHETRMFISYAVF